MNAKRFEGGEVALKRAVILAAAGLLLTLVFGFFDAQRALQAYHVAVVYFIGIAVGVLLINMAFQAARTKWYVVIRRVVESIPLALPLLFVLFIPVLIGAKSIFPWMEPNGLDEELRALALHRHAYLNLGFFLIRFVFYFAIWIAMGHLLHRWSVQQDAGGDASLTLRQRRLGAGGIPFVAVAMTFAAFDWQMSLDLHLASTIFGLYYFAGSFLAAFAVVILAVNASRAEGLPAPLMNKNHYHSLGKYLLTFVSFWGYIAFSQYLLIWIANLPEEVPWYLTRNRGTWAILAVALVVLHFLVPFFALLSRPLKQNPRALGWVAVYLLFIHYIDVYWVMMPALRQEHALSPHLVDLTAFVGVGAAAVAFVIWRMRGKAAIPVGDPFLAESLRYDPS
ncbi:MAG TPA: hypothetical protein VLV17_06600 [Anaeromyxobacteraceae bacterium]|nr:hypothetical protein [Anaeromyxobacteraceae bacterium]